ncbi:hypothetical protein TorRG33x02_277030 [Trema orientale]|uniref:Uncharacterized protein n=1 Tax=Trema orientale TaxID=63057 RepID=A0A2P5CQ24_TREOI|nr:hypothetical protein TorRG33x02_277030 [Trema orientale]
MMQVDCSWCSGRKICSSSRWSCSWMLTSTLLLSRLSIRIRESTFLSTLLLQLSFGSRSCWCYSPLSFLLSQQVNSFFKILRRIFRFQLVFFNASYYAIQSR